MFAYASNGGFDTVVINGGDASERLTFQDSEARLQGDGYILSATGFEQTSVWGHGGTDTANIHTVGTNNSFEAQGFDSQLRTGSVQLNTNSFEIVDVFADLAGTNSASLVGTDFADSVSATEDSAKLLSALGIEVTVHGFDNVDIDTRAGFDNSVIVGGAGVDLLRSLEQGVEYQSVRQLLRIVEAENHVFDGGEGFDEVLFDDFEDLDLLAALGDGATAYTNSRTVEAVDIEFLEAVSRPDATGLYEIDAVDFLFLLDGQWESNSSD